VFRISLQTLRARRATLAGAFVAILLAVTLACATGLLMAAALGAPGSGRMAAVDAVVRADPTITIGHGDDAEQMDVVPGPRLPAALVARVAAVPGVARAVGDIAFPVGATDRDGRPLTAAGADRLYAHGWDSAQLTPYHVAAGRAPAAPGDVVAERRLGVRVGDVLRVATPAGEGRYRVSGLADARGAGDPSQAAIFFQPAEAARLSGTAGRVNAIGVVARHGVSPAELRDRIRPAAGGAEVLAPDHAADADAGDPSAADRVELIAIFGALGGIAGLLALFVVAGAFALAIAQRRRETAVLRALGATGPQIRRLVAGEALLVSFVAGVLGVAAGRPLANAIVDVLADRGEVGPAFAPSHSVLPSVAALALGVIVGQLAVVSAARRAGRIPPADALREVAIEHPRPGILRVLFGTVLLAGGVAMAIVFSGFWAMAFAVLGGMMLASGTGLLGRWLLGFPAALFGRPLRLLGATGLLAGTGLSTNRWRSAALAAPILMVTMLAGLQSTVELSNQRHTESVTRARTVADRVVVGAAGAPLPAGTATEVSRLAGVDAVAAIVPTDVYPLAGGLVDQSPWPAAGLAPASRALDPQVVRGSLSTVHGSTVAVSRAFADAGDLRVGDTFAVRLADTAPATLRVGAVYDRAAGLADVLLDHGVAQRHAAVAADSALFVDGGRAALARYAADHPSVRVLSRERYLDTVHTTNVDGAWGVWLIVGLATVFAALALINTAAMSATERRDELATIRLLGGTRGHAIRMVMLETLPTVAAGAVAGAAIVAVALSGVPRGVTGVPLTVPLPLVAALIAGAAVLGLLGAAVTTAFALRATPTEALRGRE
jgi:putative ABC transport system permease protein